MLPCISAFGTIGFVLIIYSVTSEYHFKIQILVLFKPHLKVEDELLSLKHLTPYFFLSPIRKQNSFSDLSAPWCEEAVYSCFYSMEKNNLDI